MRVYLSAAVLGGNNVTQEKKWCNLPKLGFPAVRLAS